MHSCCFRNDLQGTYSIEKYLNVYVYVYLRICCPSLQKHVSNSECLKRHNVQRKAQCQLRLDSKRRPPSGCIRNMWFLSDGDHKDGVINTAIIFFCSASNMFDIWPSWFAWRWTYPRDLNSATSPHRNLLKRWKQSLNLQTRSRLGHDSFPWCYLCWADRS